MTSECFNNDARITIARSLIREMLLAWMLGGVRSSEGTAFTIPVLRGRCWTTWSLVSCPEIMSSFHARIKISSVSTQSEVLLFYK